MSKDEFESYDLGANSYVCEPVGFNEFQEAVNRLSGYSMTLNEPPPKQVAHS
jgi:two-component system response regulator